MKNNRFTNEDIRNLCLSLGTLHHAGIALGDGFALMAEDEERPAKKAMFLVMAAKADQGSSLAEILKEGYHLPAYVDHLVAVGEETGRLDEALTALAEYYDQRLRLERQIRTSLTYPAVLLIIMLSVIAVLLVKVLPIFDQVYGQLGSQLTGIAGGLLALGQVLSRCMPVLLILLAMCVAAGGVLAASASARERAARFWNGRFGTRGVSGELNYAKVAQVMAMGMKSGLPAEEVLKLAGEMVSDVPALAQACRDCSDQLAAGQPLVQSLKKYNILPASECRLLDVAVRSGTSDSIMEEIADRLLEQSEMALAERVGRVEPAIVVVTTVLIGLILLSVMLPLMHIMTAIG